MKLSDMLWRGDRADVNLIATGLDKLNGQGRRLRVSAVGFSFYTVVLLLIMGMPGLVLAEPLVKEASVQGVIEGDSLTLKMVCEVVTKQNGQRVRVAQGPVVVDRLTKPAEGATLTHDLKENAYDMTFARAGIHQIELSMAVGTQAEQDWKVASVALPGSAVRELTIWSDRQDIEVNLPGAVRVERKVVEGRLRVTGLQRAGDRFTVRWKPKVQGLDAAMVATTKANTIATVSAGSLRLDTLLYYAVAQGQLTSVACRVPEGLAVTQVRGAAIRSWEVVDAKAKGERILQIALSRPQRAGYRLQVICEAALPSLPTKAELPVIQPMDVIRSEGNLVIGTDSAIKLIVGKLSGLTQVDAASVARVALSEDLPRPMPKGKVFAYRYASMPYAMRLELDNVTPNYDATFGVVAKVGQDELSVKIMTELEVRDAPLRDVVVAVPSAFTVLGVTGAEVEGYRVMPTSEDTQADEPKRVLITFAKPLRGRTALVLGLEMGSSPLGIEAAMSKVGVEGAQTQRGYIVLAAEEGVELREMSSEGLREISPASLPQQVPGARLAYRFREYGWSFAMTPKTLPTRVQAEALHMLTLGEGVAYGNMIVSYFITGSPTDTLSFEVDPRLSNVEFVGSDVRSSAQDPKRTSRWTVKLQRRVIGDYNLAVNFTQRLDATEVVAGGVRCDGVDSQAGYFVLASRMNVKLKPVLEKESTLIEIEREDLPANYRLMIGSPLLAAYRYVNTPSPIKVGVSMYDRGSLLSSLIELTDINTRVVPSTGGNTESFTTVTYQVKNASSQFLALTLPQGAKVWTTKWIEQGQPHRQLNASFDPNSGELLVPLERPRDPNAPLTLEVQYGQVHKDTGWRGHLMLGAPQGSIPTTFESWNIQAPADWAVLDDGSSMTHDLRDQAFGSPGRLLALIQVAWRSAFEEAARRPLTLWILGGLALAAAVFMLALKRFEAEVLVVVGLLVFVWLGVLATRSSGFDALSTPDDLSSIHMTQVLSAEAAVVKVNIVPAWRQYLGWLDGVLLPAICIAAMFLAVWMRKLRMVLLAAGLTGLIYTASQVSVAGWVLGHLLTWGLPAVLLTGWLVLRGRVLLQPREKWSAPPAVAGLLLAATVGICGGCASTQTTVELAEPVIHRIELNLEAEADAIAGTMSVEVSSDRATKITLLKNGPILLPSEIDKKGVAVESTPDGVVLNITQPGRYQIDIKILAPFTNNRDGLYQRVEMYLPPAVINHAVFKVSKPDFSITSPTAVRVHKQSGKQSSEVEAVFYHGKPLVFVWKPQERRRENEEKVFYTNAISLARFETGRIENQCWFDFDISQGQIDEFSIDIPAGHTVTEVAGADLGAWRFDPLSNRLEVKLTQPAKKRYSLRVVSQQAQEGLPYKAVVSVPSVSGTQRQSSMIGLVGGHEAILDIAPRTHEIHVEDYVRDAKVIWPGVANHGIVLKAFRLIDKKDEVRVSCQQVVAELRSTENASFTVSDERLVYNGSITSEISKAGVFEIRLILPQDYDLDALVCPLMRHYEETSDEKGRQLVIHLKEQTLGQVPMQLTMSRTLSSLGAAVQVPRLEVASTLKHRGQLVVSAELGVRLDVDERHGVSEIDPADLGLRQRGARVFRMLRPDWSLTLATQKIEPSVTAEFVHIAEVGEGVVSHTHHRRYLMKHAGVKRFELDMPADAEGVVVTGSQIARVGPVEGKEGRYLVELSGKQFGKPYSLTIRYETRFDRNTGQLEIASVEGVDVEREQGYVAVMTTPRVELFGAEGSAELQPIDGRSVPMQLGAGDLSSAALCYRASRNGYDLPLEAKRYGGADLLDASVLSTDVMSVVTEAGEALTHVNLEMQVLGRRHLHARLPDKAEVWSLVVGGRPIVPSTRIDAGELVHVIPLPPDAAEDIQIDVQLIYRVPGKAAAAWSSPEIEGPRFDLPLHNITWRVFAPQGYHYDDFDGSLPPTPETRDGLDAITVAFDQKSYAREVEIYNRANLSRAVKWQSAGNKLANSGKQRAARQALESAIHYSQSDVGLNEDARVQLHELAQQQALVGIVESRNRLRERHGYDVQQREALDEEFSPLQAQNTLNSLSQADTDNLFSIIERLIETDSTATATAAAIQVQLPRRGQVLTFQRSIQVEPNEPMFVRFAAEKPVIARMDTGPIWSIGVFVVLLVFAYFLQFACGRMFTERRRFESVVIE